MAHNINVTNGKHSFYSLKEKAWHGLGQVVEEAQTSDEVIHLAGLNYDVEKVPVFADFRKLPKLETNEHHAKKGEVVPNYFATVRTDTRQVLGLVGNRYEVVQNSQAFKFIDDIVGSKQAVFETAGALGNGEKIFVTAKLPSYIRIQSTDDIIEKYLIFTSSHDGSGPVIAGLTPIRVVCNNTLNMALKRLSNKLVLRHTRNVNDRLELGRTLMGMYKVYSEEFQESMNALAKVAITEEIIDTSIKSLILDTKEIALLKEGKPADVVISTRKRNTMIDIKRYVEGGVGQNLHRGTALWLWNGVSSYYNNGKSYKDQQDRFESLTDGLAYRNTQRMFNDVMSMVQ